MNDLVKIAQLAMELGKKLLDYIPNYEQREKKELLQEMELYHDEISKDFPFRDDNMCDYLRERILLKLSNLPSKVPRPKLSDVPGQ